jgi:hypothetical protein
MWFHFFVGNHGNTGRGTLVDMMPWLTGGLAQAGHKVTIGETIAPNAMNVIFENFGDADVQVLEDYSFKFGVVATEIPVVGTFNGRYEEPWLTRRRSFDKIVQRAQFIWSFVEEPVEAYAQWAPAGYLELGFLESIVDPVFSREPEFDFGFYGLHWSPYRCQVLERLRKHFSIATPTDFLIGSALNNFIATFRVGICLKHTPSWPIPSPGRVARLLHAKRGIAAEYVPAPTRASALAPMAEKDQDFAEFCLECISGPWKSRADEAFERYRDTMPMKEIMERLLDETVANSAISYRSSNLVSSDDGHRAPVSFSNAPPRLLHSEGGYNFVAFASRVYALAQEAGEIDVAGDLTRIVERFGPRAVIIARTVNEARLKLQLQPV